jgi:hypothetical protein
MKPISKTFLILLIINILNNQFLIAQERLTGLSVNPYLPVEQLKEIRQRKDKPLLTLPFVEDFSNYTGYPNPQLFMDQLGFVNNTFPIKPPSIGVVTLDALDATGRIYAHASNSSFSADTLTSHPIRLDTLYTGIQRLPINIGDSLYFSFFYQPAGGCASLPAVNWERIGDRPESGDLLLLEFGYATGNQIFSGFEYTDYILTHTYQAGDSIENPFYPGTYYYFETITYAGTNIQLPSDSVFIDEYVWDEVWRTGGVSLDIWLQQDSLQYFKQVMIPIIDSKYLRNNFQFRFRNYASLEDGGISAWAGNVDQWHIDYIRLDVNRSYNDYYPKPADLCFIAPTSSILKRYSEIPWKQFTQNDLKSNFFNQVGNLSTGQQNSGYGYSAFKNGVPCGEYPFNQCNINPYPANTSLCESEQHTKPPISPINIAHDSQDSVLIEVVHLFSMWGNNNNDPRRENDTFRLQQHFYNYYAYDDGTAEAAYSILSNAPNPEVSLAVQFDLNKPDTLRSIRIFFPHVLNDVQAMPFTLKVWSWTTEINPYTNQMDTVPGIEIYTQEVGHPQMNEHKLDFVDYMLDIPQYITNIFFVGYTHIATQPLSVGFDQNNDARGYFYYKIGEKWQDSFYKGTPMIRAVLGAKFNPVRIQNETINQKKIAFYPNPTNGKMFFHSSPSIEQLNLSKIRISDMYGRVLNVVNIKDEQGEIDLSSYPSGFYILSAYDIHNRLIQNEKAIKQ